MTVPSYEDLTPGIADVEHPAIGLLSLLEKQHRCSADQEPVRKQTNVSPDLLSICSRLFACLRGQPCDTLQAIARDWSPRVMRVSETEVVIDISGLGRLIGGPSEIAGGLARAVHDAGLAASVGLAVTQTAARLLTWDDRVRDALAPPADAIAALPIARLLPLETLPRGMNDRDRARPYEIFEKWGLATLGDVAALPSDAFASRLGRRGALLQRLARGEDLRPFVPDADAPRYIERLELEWPIETLEPLSFVLARLLDPLAAALERADRAAAAIRLDLRLIDRTTHARLLQLPAAIRDARVLRTLLLLDVVSHPPSSAIDRVAIEIDPAPSRITQCSLLVRALPSAETLSTLMARLSALVGETRVGSPALLDSHRPDAFEMRRYAPENGANGAEGAKGAEGAGAKGAKGVKGADAEGAKGAEGVANGPAAGVVLRRCRPAMAMCVRVAHGRPVHVAPSRRGVPSGAIAHAAGPWRSSGGWWNRKQEAEDRRQEAWNRDEWDIALASGPVCRIYLDRLTNCWFLEGTYD
ncbi:MAG: hypothetical protein ACRD1V_00550 [Vicinamibacterales bacterium]